MDIGEMPDNEWREGVTEAAQEVCYLWERFSTAGTAPLEAAYLVQMSNAVSDLNSWLPEVEEDD